MSGVDRDKLEALRAKYGGARDAPEALARPEACGLDVALVAQRRAGPGAAP